MTFFQMKCFLKQTQTRKMSITAAYMGLSISTLSKYLDKMEDELGVKLFTKGDRRTCLTREGELIYPSIEYMVKQNDEQREDVQKYKHTCKTPVYVGMTFHQKQLVRWLLRFGESHPEIELKIDELPAEAICTLLDEEGSFIGITYEQLVEKKYPHVIPLRQDRIVAVVSDKHPLASRKSISLSELSKDTFFLFNGDVLMYQYQLRACISAGYVPHMERGNMRVSTILLSVGSGAGVSLLVENTVKSLAVSGVTALPLEEPLQLTMSAFTSAAYPNELQRMILDGLDGLYNYNNNNVGGA